MIDMPRQRTHHTRNTHDHLDDFPERLDRFREASGLTWAELGRRLGTHPQTLRRWRNEGVRPNGRHMMALLDIAASLDLQHLLTSQNGPTRAGAGHNNTMPGGLLL